jgi:hypothetical protein
MIYIDRVAMLLILMRIPNSATSAGYAHFENENTVCVKSAKNRSRLKV